MILVTGVQVNLPFFFNIVPWVLFVFHPKGQNFEEGEAAVFHCILLSNLCQLQALYNVNLYYVDPDAIVNSLV